MDSPSKHRYCAPIENAHKLVYRSIGVSNFNVPQLETLLASAKIKPVANQVRLARVLYFKAYLPLRRTRSCSTPTSSQVRCQLWNLAISTALSARHTVC